MLRQRRPQVHPHPQHSMPAVRGDGSARDLSAIASSVDALQRKLEEHHLLGHRHMGSLGPQDLGQVAAAAAAAAAQTVRQESHAELSQVLKAVLLQQSRLGGGAAHAGASAATTPWAVHTAQDNVHVQGQLLIPPEPGTRPVASATPQVCSGMFACIATLVQVGVVHPFGKGCVPARRCHHEDVPAACCARFCVAITAGSWACRGALQQWHRIHRPKHQASQRLETWAIHQSSQLAALLMQLSKQPDTQLVSKLLCGKQRRSRPATDSCIIANRRMRNTLRGSKLQVRLQCICVRCMAPALPSRCNSPHETLYFS